MRIYVQPDAYICVGLRIRTRRLVPPYVQTNAYVHKKTLMFLKKLGKFLEKLGKFFKNISTFFMQEQIESPSPIRSFLLFPSSLHSSQNTLFIKRLKMTALPLILVSAVLSKSLHNLPSEHTMQFSCFTNERREEETIRLIRKLYNEKISAIFKQALSLIYHKKHSHQCLKRITPSSP